MSGLTHDFEGIGTPPDAGRPERVEFAAAAPVEYLTDRGWPV